MIEVMYNPSFCFAETTLWPVLHLRTLATPVDSTSVGQDDQLLLLLFLSSISASLFLSLDLILGPTECGLQSEPDTLKVEVVNSPLEEGLVIIQELAPIRKVLLWHVLQWQKTPSIAGKEQFRCRLEDMQDD